MSEKRRLVLRRLTGAAAAGLGMLAGAGAAAAKDDDRHAPQGRPFQFLFKLIVRTTRQLEAQIRALSGRIDDLETGEVEQLRIDGGDGEPHRLLFGPTDLCVIEVDPGLDTPDGLMLRDPGGIRIMPPAASAGVLTADEVAALPPTLLFGPTNDCRITVGGPDQHAGLIIYDPEGLQLRSPLQGAPGVLSFGPGCSLRAGASADNEIKGMIFEDPEGFLFEGGALQAGVVQAKEFIQTSSAALKENVRPIDDALDKVKALQGVYFDWNREQGGKPDLGFIAESVETVLPEAVTSATRDAPGGTKGVKYGNVVALAVEGIKAQQAEIERLESENAELREALEGLRGQVESIAARLA